MRIWILGSGTLRPDPRRGSPGHWIEVGGDRILLDCGSGSLRTLARLRREWARITHLILTHFHTDHVGDLAPLLFALRHLPDSSRSAPLHLLGPAGIDAHLRALAEAHGDFVLNPGFPLVVQELEAGEPWEASSGRFRLHTVRTRHTGSSLAYRLESPAGIFAFTGDTGPDPELGAFLRGADVLVAECSVPDGQEVENHLTPGQLAALARQASPRLLVNVHAYAPLDPEDVPQLLRAAGYTGDARAGADGMEIQVSPEGVRVEAPDLRG